MGNAVLDLLDSAEDYLSKRFDWFDARYERHPRLAILWITIWIAFLFVFLPLVGIAFFNDIFGAIVDVFDQVRTWKLATVVAIVGLWLVASVLLMVISRRQLAVALRLYAFRRWCSQNGCSSLATALAEQKRELVGSWQTFLTNALPANRRPSDGWVVAVNALVRAYLGGLAALRTGQPVRGVARAHLEEPTQPLLPSNFVLYAHCVQEVREKTSLAYSSSPDVTIAIRTLLTKDIARWYNILRLHLPSDDTTIWCSTRWWEDYKERVRHSNLVQQRISLHRLLRQDRVEADQQKQYLRLHIRKDLGYEHKFLSPSEFLAVKQQLADTYGTTVRWIDGLENVTEAGQVPEVPIHPICTIDTLAKRDEILRNWAHDRFSLSSAFEDYRSFHATFGQCGATPAIPGAWGKLIDRTAVANLAFMRDYDDLFLVEFKRTTEPRAVLGCFGISFRIEEPKDIAGIRLLDSNELSTVIEQFDRAWALAQPL